jgi:phosphoribosylformylglycinamidine synthase
VAEAARNLSCVGALPLAVTDNLNFGSPENPVGYWQLHEACRGIADACRELGTPVTGGNVSLYNETIDEAGNSQSIYPTPVIGMIGLVTDINKIVRKGWQQAGDVIYLLGNPLTSLAGSEYLATLGLVTGRPMAVDLTLEKKVQSVCRWGIEQGIIRSAHDCSEGGLGVTLAECCLSSALSCTINLSLITEEQSMLSLLFGESPSRIVVSVAPGGESEFCLYLREQLNDRFYKIGLVNESQDLVIYWQDQKLIETSRPQMAAEYNSLNWD